MRDNLKPGGLPLLLGVCPAAALAFGLGDPAVESSIGQPLRVRVPLTLQPGEAVFAECIALRPPQSTGAEFALPRGRVEIMEDGRHILVTSASPVTAPAASFSLRSVCSGQEITRDFTVLLDPPGATAAPPAEKPAARPTHVDKPAQKPPGGTRWELRPGESVTGIAAAIYPGAPRLQRTLASAIVQASPAAFPDGNPDRAAPGSAIIIPDLRTLGAGEAGRPPPRAPVRASSPAPDILPLSAYLAVLEKISQLEALLGQIRAWVTALPDVSSAQASPVTATAGRAETGESAGASPQTAVAAAALLFALGAAVFLALRKRRAPVAAATTAAPSAAMTEIPPPAPASEPSPAASGVDAALQEAQLSVARGYPERAFELLQQHIRAQPTETRTWMLFFAILRSQHMTKEYAELASRFAATRPAAGLWHEVQRMGRELDPDNRHYRKDDFQDLLDDWNWEENSREMPSQAKSGGDARS